MPFDGPLVFAPLFYERVWGGRALETRYRKKLPANKPIGESWELVDRAEAQSVVQNSELAGYTLHELWSEYRREVFGDVSDTPRFPVLIKLLDCREKLSLQVHPPQSIASSLGGEPKSEFWFIADAISDAELWLGVRPGIDRKTFADAIESGRVEELVARVKVRAGDAFYIPSGRLHAIGTGNLIVEVQQNSDSTYRVFDWNRTDALGKRRTLHVNESLACIDFADTDPRPITPQGETLLDSEFFRIEKWHLVVEREIAPRGQCAIVCVLEGEIVCAEIRIRAGGFFLLPAESATRSASATNDSAQILCITLPRES